MKKIQINASTIKLSTALFIVFLVLKLCKVIHWSWWWVFAPLWIGPACSVIIILLILLIAFMLTLLSGLSSK